MTPDEGQDPVRSHRRRGVTEHDFAEPPLNRDKGISLQKLFEKA